MRTAVVLAALAAVSFPCRATETPVIQGEYVEARTCDVWTGPCFANGEINLVGKQAVAAWIVTRGSWDGVPVDGLKVAAAITAEGTLHTEGEGRVSAVLFVDDRASARQADALSALARTLAPRHLARVVAVERRPITFAQRGLEAVLQVGDVATVKTTAFCACDKVCCNEERAYPSISTAATVDCAKTLENSYRGAALGSSWSESTKRGSMVGTFAK
jgi:hypothetical protein